MCRLGNVSINNLVTVCYNTSLFQQVEDLQFLQYFVTFPFLPVINQQVQVMISNYFSYTVLGKFPVETTPPFFGIIIVFIYACPEKIL